MATSDLPSVPEGYSVSLAPGVNISEYTHLSTGKKSFLHPEAPAPPAVSAPWEARTDSQGRTYYENHETKTSSWKNPVEEVRLRKEGKLEGEEVEEGKVEGYIVGYRTATGEEWWVDYRTGKLT